jgi:hypothetical protein
MTTLHVFSNRHIKNEAQNIKKDDWIYLENGMSKGRWSLYFRVNNINEEKLNITYITQEEYFTLDNINKFDCIVGNPPYQDGTKTGQQNKIYNQFSKKALELSTGTVAFVTPTSVCKKSKRFSLVAMPGLKYVDFTADKHFNDIGTTICSWVVDKSYVGNVQVCDSANNIHMFDSDKTLYDYGVVNRKVTDIADNIKTNTTIDKRMFKQNPVDASINGRSSVKTEIHTYPVYKIENSKETLVQFNKPKPKLYNKRKFVISLSKSFSKDSTVVSMLDFDVNHVFVDVDNNNQVNNIESFLFSDYFIEFVNEWKKFTGHGFNVAIKYLPVFDMNKTWTNAEVKEFIESYAN